ncbi:DUF1559 domain-containing protein [bacterium]|nr:MAG: DUF1559 domain-containing protein [bacterium]
MKKSLIVNRNNAFTLIELLVVIAIIAILAAILFPVFARARENARRASCQSNLKQIGLGILQYQQDYDERFPGRYNPGTNQSWRGLIQPYVKSTQLFQCPSNTGAINNGVAWPLNSVPLTPISYVCNGINADVGATNMGGSAPMPDLGGVSSAAVNDVARTILVTESSPTWQWPEANVSGTPIEFRDQMFAGHLGQVNFLFVDGHVKSMKPLATGTPTNMWNIEEVNDAFPPLIDRLAAWQTKVQ